jgi:hypothetical protein
MQDRPNPKHPFLGRGANCGSGGRILMAPFLNGITGTAPLRNTTVKEFIRASFDLMAPR